LLYKVTLNWSGELLTFYTHSKSEKGALKNSVTQLSKKLGINYTVCNAKFLGQRANFKIEKEIKNEPYNHNKL